MSLEKEIVEDGKKIIRAWQETTNEFVYEITDGVEMLSKEQNQMMIGSLSMFTSNLICELMRGWEEAHEGGKKMSVEKIFNMMRDEVFRLMESKK